jgi:transposase
MKKEFIGVDFSKKKFDVSVIDGEDMSLLGQNSFANDRSGYKELLAWLKEITHVTRKDWMFCGEHTGLYGMGLCSFLISKELFIWMENPLQIKLSTGIKRGKSDPADSRMIAEYACRNWDKAKPYKLPEKDLQALDQLLSHRQRLLDAKQPLLVAATELRACYQRDTTARYIYEDSLAEVERLNKRIKSCERKMLEIIRNNEALKENYEIVSSIKGIALINTIAMLVVTQNFTLFDNPRQYACYAGLAPFGKQSGSSISGKPHVSHLANKKIKVLLTQAAKCAIQHNPQLKAYYERKIAEGKNKWLVLNNVRSKLVHCAFAMVAKKERYQAEYVNPIKPVRIDT